MSAEAGEAGDFTTVESMSERQQRTLARLKLRKAHREVTRGFTKDSTLREMLTPNAHELA